MKRNLDLMFLMITCFLFLSLSNKKKPGTKDQMEWPFYVHSRYYDTGELKYKCRDFNAGTSGRTTAMIQKMKFKRQYYDKCGTLKLIVKGRLETGCWKNEVVILSYIEKNKDLACEKEVFINPTLSELETELKSE